MQLYVCFDDIFFYFYFFVFFVLFCVVACGVCSEETTAASVVEVTTSMSDEEFPFRAAKEVRVDV